MTYRIRNIVIRTRKGRFHLSAELWCATTKVADLYRASMLTVYWNEHQEQGRFSTWLDHIFFEIAQNQPADRNLAVTEPTIVEIVLALKKEGIAVCGEATENAVLNRMLDSSMSRLWSEHQTELFVYRAINFHSTWLPVTTNRLCDLHKTLVYKNPAGNYEMCLLSVLRS